MDPVKIGKFIAQCRKKANLTQMQLAEKLSITDRAVSKWETGKSMPDSSIMLDLCDALTVATDMFQHIVVFCLQHTSAEQGICVALRVMKSLGTKRFYERNRTYGF